MGKLASKKQWQSKWIARPNTVLVNWEKDVLPAPYFRKEFDYTENSEDIKIFICGLGFYELYINGQRVGDHVLDPVVTQYDKRARYVIYDVAKFLQSGKNVIGVILGNGWYNSHTPDHWHFDKASWRDYPKLSLQLEVNQKLFLSSDTSWKMSDGPIVFDGLRNGEIYDAQLELGDWSLPNFDDTGWHCVAQVPGPGGFLEEQIMPPCKIMQTLESSKQWELPSGDFVYDIGQNMAGWARITVIGKKGTQLTIKYSENIKENHDIHQELIAYECFGDKFQTDIYTLKGEGTEIWEPRFTYHGFRYLRISGNLKDIEIQKIEGRVIHTAFEKTGQFSCSNETLNQLQRCTEWSFISNFVGIPTDCPHREKNGWTGDAQLVVETGLINYSSGTSYTQWLDSFADVQRPNGQLPGIVPSAGWGFNWGSGPAWDSAFLIIPWYVYLYTGDTSAMVKYYSFMKKYVDYCTEMSTENIVSFGLGDWCHVDQSRITDSALTSTAYYYFDCLLISKFAVIANKPKDEKKYLDLAAKIKIAFNKEFYKGDGIYGKGEQTALACALYWNLVDASEKDKVLNALLKNIEGNNYKPDFGILGAQYVIRSLSENGYVDAAYKIITQPEFPGWKHWLDQGATTLWEKWSGAMSQNHIMFGDISAWMYQYLGGITIDENQPGFKHVIIKPNPVSDLNYVNSSHICSYGRIVSNWQIKDNEFTLKIEIPTGTTGTVILPNNSIHKIHSGKHQFSYK